MIYQEVMQVEALDDYAFKVKFTDGLEGVVSISKIWLSGVFAPLVNLNLFQKVYANKESGAVSWDIDGQVIDLAPDTMYKEIKKNGVYLIK